MKTFVCIQAMLFALKAFLFYGSNFKIHDLPALRKNTIRAVFHEESPRNVAVFLGQKTFQFFNVTATFSRFSDLPLTLQYLESISIITETKYLVSVETKNKLLGTIAPVLYIQSDCDTPNDRDIYVAELMKYIPVDSYGKCLNNRKFPQEIANIDNLDLYNEKLLHFIARYKFTISFENAICEDYITEKLWRPLLVGSVPIYLGSPSVQDWLPNKNSAILAQNLKPKQLAQLIGKANGDDHLYGSFLEHKRGKIDNDLLKETLARGPYGLQTFHENIIFSFECYVCQVLHQGLKKKPDKNVYDCARPSNSWESHWTVGEAESRFLSDLREN